MKAKKKEKIVYNSFNIEIDRPKAILLGNGVIYNVESKWEKIIDKLAKNEVKKEKIEAPYSLMATIITDSDDRKRQEKYLNYFTDNNDKGEKYKYFKYELIDELLKLPFNAILTTNYTYEIENALVANFSILEPRKQSKFACFQNPSQNSKFPKDSRYLLRTFNRLYSKAIGQRDIWHIHGEVRRKTSMVLTHDEYARLIGEILKYNKARADDYEKKADNLEFKSWIDYFIMADLYIVGQSFDFSEFDLWWLLNRRIRERGKIGKVVFYEPVKKDNSHKLNALDAMGVECKTLDIVINDETENYKYQEFYQKVIKDIQFEELNELDREKEYCEA